MLRPSTNVPEEGRHETDGGDQKMRSFMHDQQDPTHQTSCDPLMAVFSEQTQKLPGLSGAMSTQQQRFTAPQKANNSDCSGKIETWWINFSQGKQES